ncbi:hypothetical protein [Thiohalomonas denitrificans]|uniref:Uncharacterized protein n=1 Tax=Thiohalomonas denitrificans TaxID=415747 RepID=A0A1G5PS35_9GAMM|nr:hypothetical protein [Thiohalomonas denitrificans]SCZ52272.1 hypothetical protein SAMN03097708_00713 [Thiohalomonas denitrificans]
MEKLFRTLLVISLVLYLVWVGSFYFAHWLFSPQVANAVVHTGAESLLQMPEPLLWMLPVLWLIAAIGMWQFAQGARTFYVVLTASSLVVAAISGVLIQSPAQTVLADVVSLCDGAIIAMAYLTRLDARFRGDASNIPLQPTAGSGG